MSQKMVNVCKHNKEGYCKFHDKCKYLHVNEVCIDKTCEKSTCEKRHPKACHYFMKFNRCKFGEYCKYSHESFNDTDVKMKTLERKIECLEDTVHRKDQIISDLQARFEILECNFDKIQRQIQST